MELYQEVLAFYHVVKAVSGRTSAYQPPFSCFAATKKLKRPQPGKLRGRNISLIFQIKATLVDESGTRALVSWLVRSMTAAITHRTWPFGNELA